MRLSGYREQSDCRPAAGTSVLQLKEVFHIGVFWYDRTMRTVKRDIVGAFIFSSDGKLLLGKNRSGGVYEGSYVIPAGGVDDGESNIEALRREIQEETGIDINEAEVSTLHESSGKHEKTLKETGERVLVKMSFHDYRVELPIAAAQIKVVAEDDWAEPHWFSIDELSSLNLAPPTRNNLVKAGMILG